MDQSLKQSFRLKSFTIVNRQTKETKTNYWFWLKGPVDRCWTEILETVTTLSRLSLFSGEELELVNSTKIIFETPHIDNVNKNALLLVTAIMQHLKMKSFICRGVGPEAILPIRQARLERKRLEIMLKFGERGLQKIE